MNLDIRASTALVIDEPLPTELFKDEKESIQYEISMWPLQQQGQVDLDIKQLLQHFINSSAKANFDIFVPTCL